MFFFSFIPLSFHANICSFSFHNGWVLIAMMDISCLWQDFRSLFDQVLFSFSISLFHFFTIFLCLPLWLCRKLRWWIFHYFMIVSISLSLPLSFWSSVIFIFYLSLSGFHLLSFSFSLSDCVANCDDGYFMFVARFYD